MSTHSNMKINDLFVFIAEHVDDEIKRRSLYDTVREIIRARRDMSIANKATAMLDKYNDLFEYFVDNFSADDSDRHVKNLDFIHDLYYTFSESDADDDNDGDDEVEVDDDSDDTDTDDDTGNKVDVNVVIDADLSEIKSVVEDEHKKTRTLLSAGVMLSVAQIVLSSYMLAKGLGYV